MICIPSELGVKRTQDFLSYLMDLRTLGNEECMSKRFDYDLLNIINFFIIELKENPVSKYYRTMKQIYNDDLLKLCSKESISKCDLENINIINQRLIEFNEVDKL